MSEDAASPADDMGDCADALRAVLLPFAQRYFDALSMQDGSSKLWRSWYWGPHLGIPDLFVPLDLPTAVADFDQWDEYKAVETLVRRQPRLHRLVTQPMYAQTDPVPEFKGLFHGVVLMAIERYQAIHGTDQEEFPSLIDELTDWFCRDADPMFVAASITSFIGSGTVTLASGIMVRRATDDEVSAMLQIGALNLGLTPHPTMVSSTHVPEAARWIVAMDHLRPRRFGLPEQKVDQPDRSVLDSAAGAWMAALRILTPAEVRLGATLTTQLIGGMMSGGSVNRYGPPVPFAWSHPATATPDTLETFVEVAHQILDGHARDLGVQHGVHRFSEVTTRSSLADRHVDLVIALESMFSEGGDSISYKVSRRASVMARPIGLPAATIYQFVRDAYNARSQIVHGGSAPTYRNLARQTCTADEEVRILDRLVATAFRQVLSWPSNAKPPMTADGIIHTSLDSQTGPPCSDASARYEATIRHDGNDFTAILPVDETFLVRGDSVDQLRKQLADAVALWTKEACQPDQIDLVLDDDAKAATSANGGQS
jgi:hypothetical protein